MVRRPGNPLRGAKRESALIRPRPIAASVTWVSRKGLAQFCSTGEVPRSRMVTYAGGVDDDTALLEPRIVTTIKEEFWVPAYQRGYRWGAVEVRRLLDDIRNSGSDDYYLQPVVVKSRQDGMWELIDGQQRLTTLYLILKYLGEHHLPSASPAFRLEYETRDGSGDYLDELDPEKADSNIDYFHIYAAYSALRSWFENENDPTATAIDLYQALSKRVRVIWYEAPASINSTVLFTRLNLGRIPLTDAELIKAQVLSQVRLNRPDRLIEVAAQWDSVERDLRAPEAWAFISGAEEDQPSHIDVVLDALAGIERDRTTPPYATFERLSPRIQSEPIEFWNDVLAIHAQVLGWFGDIVLYHRVGYLVSRNWTLARLLGVSHGKSRSEFRERVTAAIREDLNLSADGLPNLSYTSKASSRALLLMNLETSMRAQSRFSFDAYAAGDWSLEHIHAQNSEQLTKEAQWREWIRLSLDALAAIPESGAAEATQHILEDVPSAGVPMKRSTFEGLEARILTELERHGQEPLEDVHSIDNLALLSGGLNSALSNSTFAVKRRELLERDKRGEYIPLCTRNVFLKYYTPTDDQQLHVWSPADRAGYLAAMEETLKPYLTEEATEDE